MGSRSGSPVLELLVAFALVYVLQVVTGFANLVGDLFVLTPPLDREPWTLVTSVYAHANVEHLVSNAVALVLVGWPVARSTTRTRFHLFFVFAGAVAGASQIALTDLLTLLPFVGVTATSGVLGASGGVFALLGYLLASNRLSTRLATAMRIPRWLSALAFLVVAGLLTMATASPGAALVAHFVGLLLGLFAGRIGILDLGPDGT